MPDTSALTCPKGHDLQWPEIEKQFSDVRLLAEDSRVRVFMARHLQSGQSLVLKCLLKETNKSKDFYREFNYHSSLSSHANVVKCVDDAFETETAYVLTQELAPLGDLSKFVSKGGIGELKAKRVVEQVARALEFAHKKGVVHRDLCLKNIFVFDRHFFNVKLGDFGDTQRIGSLVKKSKVRSPWAAPEVTDAVDNEGYYVQVAHDAWQLGILIFVCLTGAYPWSSADISDRNFNAWLAYLKRKTTKTPQRFKGFTPRLLRLLRRLLEPRPEMRRCVKEIQKYLSDPWTETADSNESQGKTNREECAKVKRSATFTARAKSLMKIQRSLSRDLKCGQEVGHQRRVRFSLDGNIVVAPGI